MFTDLPCYTGRSLEYPVETQHDHDPKTESVPAKSSRTKDVLRRNTDKPTVEAV